MNLVGDNPRGTEITVGKWYPLTLPASSKADPPDFRMGGGQIGVRGVRWIPQDSAVN